MYVLGDLSREDRGFLEAHLAECEECRDLIKGFERIALFDLPAVASLRTENVVPESLELANESQLRDRVLEKAKAGLARNEGQGRLMEEIARPCPTPWLRQAERVARRVVPIAGWAIAAVLLAGVLWRFRPAPGNDMIAAAPPTVAAQNSSELDALKQRALIAERQRDEALVKRDEAASASRSGALSLARMTSQYDGLDAAYSELKTEMTQQQDQLKQETAQLELTRRDLKDQLTAKDSLQGQLSEVYERLQQNGAEVARLERICCNDSGKISDFGEGD